MIQIYSPDNTDFDKNGNMVLWPSEATVHVILNSTWEASLFQPLDEDGRWKYIENNAVVKLPSFNGEQLFRIYDTDKDESGVTAKMYPIFYDAANEVFFTSVHPTDKDGQGALDVLCEGTKYSGSSDIDTVETAYYEYVNLIEALNGSIDQAFTSRWGGEILFDNYEVTINTEVGEDRGYSLTYGRNIPANGLSIETDMSDVVTRIYPQAYNGRALSGDGYMDSDLIGNYPTIRSKAITYDYIRLADDVSEDEEDSEDILICEDEDELDAALIAACEDEFADGLDKPSVTITADIVALEGTEQYQEFSGLAELSLGDTVTVYHTLLGIDTSVRVTELTYDCISETVTDITLGDFKSDYFDQTATKVANLTSAVETAREAAAAALAAANDATLLSVILSSEYQGVPVDDDGEYEELPDISTTVQVFYSNEDVTGKCDLDQSPSGLTGEWEDATYTVTEVTEDNAYVNLLISYGTLSVTKKFTVSKVYSGTEGPAGEDGKTSYFHIKYSEVESPTLASEMTEEPSTYIGTYVDFEEADSNDPSDYTWSRFEGAQGEQGEQGIAGTNGEDGQTSYLHIAYANSEDGTEDFSVSDSEDKSYIGQYVDFEEDDSTDPEDYNWTLIKGEDGDSITILSTTVRYQISDSGTDVPVTGSWSEEVPATSQGDFLWTRTIVNYSDGGTTISYSVAYIGVDGTDGKTAYFHIKYSDYESPTSTSQMTETPSAYIGTYVDYTEDDSNDPADYTWSRFQGLQGDQGVAGTNGEDGKTYYLHIAYANSEDGETDFSVTDSTDKSYIGVYTDTESSDSTDPADYSWTLIKGEDGSSVYVVSAEVSYQVGDSATETPTGTWLSEIPEVESGKFLWTKTEVVYSDGEQTEAYSISYIAKDGDDGESISILSKSVTYQSSSSGTTTPTGTWDEEVPDVSQGEYLWTRTEVEYSDGTVTTSYSVSYMALDGTDGTSVTISGTEITYQLSSSGTIIPTGTWSEDIPDLSQGKYLWTKTEVTYTDGTVTTSYAVSYLAVDGDDGEDGVTLYATCSTAAGTASKVATITPTNEDFALSTGVTINITFTYANTASSPKLNVNSTGAKSIYAFGTTLAEVYYWSAGSTVQFVYNGSQWVMTDNAAMTIAANWCYENDTTYIDGANIYAGTLAANSIIAGDTLTNALTATNLTVTGDSTFEGTITGSTITGSDIYTSGTSSSGTVVADDRWAHLYNGTIEFGHFEDDDSEVLDGYVSGSDGGEIGLIGSSNATIESPSIYIRTSSSMEDDEAGIFLYNGDYAGVYVYGETTFYNRVYLNRSSGDAMYESINSSTDYQVAFGVGSGGYNRGIYDRVASKWGFALNSSNEIMINGVTRLIGSGSIYTAGFVSSSTKKVYFSIPYIAYGASPTLTISSVALRQEGSYLGGGSSSSNSVTQSFSTSYTYYKAGYFQVILTFSSTITNGINNDVVAVSCSYTVA